MFNPARKILDQCRTGFTLPRKLGLTGLAVLYLLVPLDILPDFLPGIGQIDDLFALYVLVRVWCSPTLDAMKAAAIITRPASIRQLPATHEHVLHD